MINDKWTLEAYAKLQTQLLDKIVKKAALSNYWISERSVAGAWIVGSSYHAIAIPDTLWVLDADKITDLLCPNVRRINAQNIWDAAPTERDIKLTDYGTQKTYSSCKPVHVLVADDGTETWIDKSLWDVLKPLRVHGGISLHYTTSQTAKGPVSVWDEAGERVALLLPVAH